MLPAPLSHSVTVAGETLEALPERALYWPFQHILFIADLHAGKLGHFQRHGIPLPDHETDTDLARLDDLITRLNPTRLIILGDMFHSDNNATWPKLVAWRATHANVSIELVFGNHDRHLTANVISNGDFLVHPKPIKEGPFLLSHEPYDVHSDKKLTNLCGHVHPATMISLRGGTKLRLPTFWLQPHRIMLPAFGSFTGMHVVKASPGDTLLAVTSEQIIPRSVLLR